MYHTTFLSKMLRPSKVYRVVGYCDDVGNDIAIQTERKEIAQDYNVPLDNVYAEYGFNSCAFVVGLPWHQWTTRSFKNVFRWAYKQIQK